MTTVTGSRPPAESEIQEGDVADQAKVQLVDEDDGKQQIALRGLADKLPVSERGSAALTHRGPKALLCNSWQSCNTVLRTDWDQQ